MKKIFLISCIYFFYIDASISLYRLKMHFDHLVVRPQSKDLDQLKNYRYVCAKALQKIENNEKVADHVWYRLELAKVIYIIGFEEFKKEVEPYLYDWSALAWIKGASCQKKFFIYHDKRLNLNSQEGHSVYFYNFLTLLQNGSHLSRIFDLRITSASLVKSSFWNKNDYSKCLLESPQNGVLFLMIVTMDYLIMIYKKPFCMILLIIIKKWIFLIRFHGML